MKYIITAPQHIDADIVLPASKSISNRALVISALAGGNQLPQNLSDCDDTRVITRALANNPYEIDIMAAGTAMRFMTAYLCTQEGEHVITGTERMRHRPIGILVDALRYLGADIEYVGEEGYPPLKIKGKTLDGGRLEMPGNVSSQYISALLMIGPSLKNGIELHLKDEIVSRPYIDLTLWTMTEYGADVEWTDVDTITVRPKPYTEREFYIENDWSASSYWYEILALVDDRESKLRLEGLMDGSKQGDSVDIRSENSLCLTQGEYSNHGNPVAPHAHIATPRLRLRQLARLGTDLCGCMLCYGYSIPFHRTCKP